MNGHGVYVWETFPGITEVRAVGYSGQTLRRVTMPTHLFTQGEVDAAWTFLERVDGRPPTLSVLRE